MARETAAQKLAKRNAAIEAEKQGAPPADPPKPKPPVLASYTLFANESVGDPAEFVWVPLGEVQAATHLAAMDVALEKASARRAAVPVPESEQAPTAVRLTVAAIASRNWNEGTALVELRPVTTWEKR